MRSGSRCPAFYGEIPPMRWGILNDDGGYFYCITYNMPIRLIPNGTRCVIIYELFDLFFIWCTQLQIKKFDRISNISTIVSFIHPILHGQHETTGIIILAGLWMGSVHMWFPVRLPLGKRTVRVYAHLRVRV